MGYNGKYLRLSDINKKDYGLYMFGCFFRYIETQNKHYIKMRNNKKLENENKICKKCGSKDTIKSKKNIKKWFSIGIYDTVCSGCFYMWHSNKMVGENNPMYGYNHTEETKNVISNKIKGRRKGKKHWNWQGGKTMIWQAIRNMEEYKYWRDSVFKRDDYRCQICDNRKGKHNAHHIKPFARILKENNIETIDKALNCNELWDVNNGVTLCVTCHKEVEKIINLMLNGKLIYNTLA